MATSAPSITDWIQASVAILAVFAAVWVPSFIENRRRLNAAIAAQNIVIVVHRVTSYIVQAAIDRERPIKSTPEQLAACSRALDRQPSESLPSELYDHVVAVAHHWECAKLLRRRPNIYSRVELGRLYEQADLHARAVDQYLHRKGVKFERSGLARAPDLFLHVRGAYRRLRCSPPPGPYRPERVGGNPHRF
ncbi:MAG: hypothetical protein VX561_01645 [Pseudomonadota bacterium]|nr:hypothetical protein [Pseudomonadota bacterium]